MNWTRATSSSAPRPRYKGNRAPAIRAPRGKSSIPRDSPSPMWLRMGKSKFGLSRYSRKTTLSPSLVETGTEGWGRFGRRRSWSCNSPWTSFRRSSSPLIRPASWPISSLRSSASSLRPSPSNWPILFEPSFRLALISSTSWRRARRCSSSLSKPSSLTPSSRVRSRRSTSWGFSRISFKSSIARPSGPILEEGRDHSNQETGPVRRLGSARARFLTAPPISV